MVFVCSVAMLAAFSGCKRKPIAKPVTFSIDNTTTHVEIANPERLSASILLIGMEDSNEVQTLDPNEDLIGLDLPSGIYSICCREESRNGNPRFTAHFALPALKELAQGNNSITVSLAAPPPRQIGWCWVPEGPALIGDILGVGAEDERPARIESVDSFWLAETEVTNSQYAEFLSAQRRIEPRWIDLESQKCRIQKLESSYVSDAAELPVVMVSLYGAQAYCDWKTTSTKDKYRLPTEIEWEKAARGPESYTFAYGNVYRQSLANQESGKLKRVKSYAPNGFGLYDMTGNAFEWMSNLNDPSQPDRIMNQSLRGGSFVLDGMYLRNSFRMRQSKSVMTDDIGFRVLREP